jgi:hypothetical protein
MKYDLAVRWGTRRQTFLITVRQRMTHFQYVISPPDSHIKTIQFCSIYRIYSVLQAAGTIVTLARLQ